MYSWVNKLWHKQVTCVYCSFCPIQGEKRSHSVTRILFILCNAILSHVRSFSTVSTVITLSHHVILIGTERWRGGCQSCGVAEPAGTCWALCPTLILPTQLLTKQSWNVAEDENEVHFMSGSLCFGTSMFNGSDVTGWDLIGVKVGERWMFLSSAEQSDITGISESTEFKHICLAWNTNAIIFMNSGCNTVQWCEARWITPDLMDAFYHNNVLTQPPILSRLRQEEHPT